MTLPKFLFHYYELDNGPFRNITEYGNEEAEKIQNKISKGWNSKRPENYIELRLTLEKRIKEKLILKGGKPNRNDPFYFTLGKCDWAKSWYVNPGVIKISLSDFKPEHISFTYPDSMISFQFYDEPKLATYRKDCNGQVFLLDEMNDIINDYGIPSDEKCLTEERLKYDKYIEAQVWDDEIINIKTKPNLSRTKTLAEILPNRPTANIIMTTNGKPSKELLENWSKDPNNWKWGVFYFNKDDKRIFPPKQNKYMGWTVNFANPISILALIVLIATIIVVPQYLKSL